MNVLCASCCAKLVLIDVPNIEHDGKSWLHWTRWHHQFCRGFECLSTNAWFWLRHVHVFECSRPSCWWRLSHGQVYDWGPRLPCSKHHWVSHENSEFVGDLWISLTEQPSPALGASKHGPFEVDQSISRIDTYFGNQANFNLDRWNNLVNIANSNGGQFGFDTFNQERQQTYQQSRDTNPEFDAEVKHFAVTLAERVFMFRALPNGTDEQNANFANVAPFFLNETFPDDWFKRGTPYTLANVGTDIVTLYAMGPTDIGHNEGLNNFVPLGADLGSLTPSEMTCFLETALLDLVPGQISPALAENYDTFVGFFNGAVKPFFAQYDCNDLNYTAPGASAGDPTPGVSAGNILLNGVYQTTTPAEPPDEDGDGPN